MRRMFHYTEARLSDDANVKLMKYITVLKFNFTQNKTVQNIQILKLRIFILIFI